MSKENAQQFFDTVKSTPELKQQFAGISDQSELTELALKLGAEQGYAFSAEDVKAAIAESENALSDEQLGDLGGGLL